MHWQYIHCYNFSFFVKCGFCLRVPILLQNFTKFATVCQGSYNNCFVIFVVWWQFEYFLHIQLQNLYTIWGFKKGPMVLIEVGRSRSRRSSRWRRKPLLIEKGYLYYLISSFICLNKLPLKRTAHSDTLIIMVFCYLAANTGIW